MDDRELIAAAAHRLRTLAGEVTPGPWHTDGPWTHQRLRLAAALGPQVAERLTWLLEAAQQHAAGPPWSRPLWVEIAVDIAGKVLGGPGPEATQ